jgi:uncharacterized protein YkwD
MRKNLTVLIMLLCGALYAQDGEPSFETSTTFELRSDQAKEVFKDLNRQRLKHGTWKLKYDSSQQKYCDAWAERMAKAGKLVHRAENEVITLAPLYLNSIIPIFMDSKPHRKILMKRNVSRVCIGICQSPWVVKKLKNGSTYATPGILYTVIRVY